MPTVKEIKDELDALGIEYPPGALKADLEALLVAYDLKMQEAATPVAEERPPVITDGFIDPNADPATQAD